MASAAGPNSVRCGHIYGDDRPERRGDQCGRMCKFGFKYCNVHGGRTPAARAQAERMLAVARMPAIEALLNIVEQFNSDVCPTCGFPNGEKETQTPVIRAAQVILDRTGFGAHQTVEVKQTDGERLNLAHLLDSERAELTALTAQLRDFKRRVKERINPGAGNSSDASAPPVAMPPGTM